LDLNRKSAPKSNVVACEVSYLLKKISKFVGNIELPAKITEFPQSHNGRNPFKVLYLDPDVHYVQNMMVIENRNTM